MNTQCRRAAVQRGICVRARCRCYVRGVPPTPEQIAGTVGAQVVLEPDSAAAAGAKGVYPTVEENTMLRDAGYVQMGLDPADPSGELTDPDAPPAPEGGAAPTNVDVPFRGTGRDSA